ncbi:hypothetical protein B0H13DRAFT_2314450 [Mycena leptocephala]|nr:hypothetical protein B0H13DRAFT_2314450 [Mycena leptocephala]
MRGWQEAVDFFLRQCRSHSHSPARMFPLPNSQCLQSRTPPARGSSFARDVSLPFLAALLSLPLPSSIALPSSALFQIALSSSMAFQITLPSSAGPNSLLLPVQLAASSLDTSPHAASPQSQFFLQLEE